MVAPAGAPGPKENDRRFAGKSTSVAVTVNVTCVSSLVDLSPIELRTGALLTSLMVMVIFSEATSEPSETIIVTWAVPGPLVSEGDQVKTPAEVILGPTGCPGPSEKVSV